ncbi:MAG TPA: tetratricopeptide repeat protein [Acidobacteriota bacterium]|nr:tetratricopeptide repeat protein [Acidobacteriota bacterium]
MNVKALEGRLKSIQDTQERLDILDALADHYYDEDDFQKALRFYQEARELAPAGNPKAYYTAQSGICHYLLHNDREARDALFAARSMSDPMAPEFLPEIHGLLHYFLGSLLEYEGKNQASLEARLEALKYIDELHCEAQWMLLAGLSRNYEELGDNRKAIEYSTRAISLISEEDPELAYLYESLGHNHYELEEFDKALAYFSRVLEVDPQFERRDDVYFAIGLCYQRLTDYKTAVDCYKKLLEMKRLAPTRQESLAWLYGEIAYCHYQLSEHEDTLRAIEEALRENIEKKEELAELRSFLTNSYQALGRYQEAVREGEKTLKISRHFPSLDLMLPNLALSYYHLGNLEQFRFYRNWCNREFPDRSWTKQLNKLKA